MDQVLATARPLPSLGDCEVAACDRDAHTRNLCNSHLERWKRRNQRPGESRNQWVLREAGINDARVLNLKGLPARVRDELLYAVYTLARRGSRRKISDIQKIVDWVREQGVASLRDLDGVEAPQWIKRKVFIWEAIFEAVRYGDQTPEDFKNSDQWPGSVFGRDGSLDFTGFRLDWLRNAVRHWCWNHLTKYTEFRTLSRAVAAVRCLDAYLADRPHRGNGFGAVGRDDLIGFTMHLSALVSARAPITDYKYRGTRFRWTENHRATTLGRIRLVLRWARDAGLLKGIPEDFALTDDLVPPRTRATEDEDTVGKALPTVVLQQMLSDAYLARLRDSWSQDGVHFVQVMAETGRRPSEIATLTLMCLDEQTPDGPWLDYVESKTTRGQRRKLPLSTSAAQIIKNQQARVLARFPNRPPTDLVLFPGALKNPSGTLSLSANSAAAYFRAWIDGLPILHGPGTDQQGDPRPFERSLVYLYALRHSFTQRYADAGTAPDVLKELMGHDQIATTMLYYRVSQQRRREAMDTVGSVLVDHAGNVVDRHLSSEVRNRLLAGTVAVPFGTCREPSNVAAEGHACPIRYQCTGCGFFKSDPSYLPELRRQLAELKAQRERVAAFDMADEWAKRRAMPSQSEIKTLTKLIASLEAELAQRPDQEQAAIEEASVQLRKARAGQTAVTIRRRADGEDALAPSALRHAVSLAGDVTKPGD
ncbi:tyrosine-type recombinase/integrase [Modestobacter roseus]|uniref:tyrosine-type recombinase/integrase n=1 Tax=Modestobacter roseus TaxID=1181884 RepID=UPI001885F713|nr:tyrosine-type recombinase/integrase [Modestobacter roseus]